MKHILALLCFAGLLSGCSAIPQQQPLNIHDQRAVEDKIITKHDDYKKQTEYIGPNAASDRLFDLLFIRAWRPDGSDKSDYQIYVMDHYYGEWRFYDSTWDSNGLKLETIEISRDVDSCGRSGCSYNEHIGINVSRLYLENHKESGINFKISGKAGEETFFIPSGYIKAFLTKIGGTATVEVDRDNPMRDKLIGKWSGPAKNARGESGTVTFEFYSDNTFFGSAEANNRLYWTFSGTYTVKENRLLWSYKKSTPPLSDMSDTDEIVELNNERLVLLNSRGTRDPYVRQK